MNNRFKLRAFAPFIYSLWLKSLIIILSVFFLAAPALASNVTVITDIKGWNHPVKQVLQKHKVVLSKVELHNQTYPVFYVRFPYDPWFGHNDKYFRPLYYETLKANGFWDYAFVDPSFDCRINIKWDKKTKTLSEGMDNIN
jgi:hypothetical protein